MVWLLQVISSNLSHSWAMKRELRPQDTRSPTWGSTGAWAVYTRLIANVLAILNAIWLVTLSTLTFTNLYNNCWCASAAFQWGSNTWIPILMTPAMVSAYSHGSWVAGTFLAITCIAATLSFFMIAKGDDLFRGDAQ